MINKLIIKEGQKTVFYLFGATVISALFICSFLTTLLAIITIFALYIYRNPSNTQMQVSDIVSVCDGTISAIDRVNDKNVIYIQLGLCDTHILRAPISSTFKIVEKRNGVNLNNDSFMANQLNEKITLKFDKIKISLLANKYNLKTVIDEPKKLSQNERFGVMVQGEVKITLPKKSICKVKIGQKVYAGSTVLA